MHSILFKGLFGCYVTLFEGSFIFVNSKKYKIIFTLRYIEKFKSFKNIFLKFQKVFCF